METLNNYILGYLWDLYEYIEIEWKRKYGRGISEQEFHGYFVESLIIPQIIFLVIVIALIIKYVF